MKNHTPIYVILDKDDKRPILVADTFKKAKDLLDEYMGIDMDEDVQFIKYEKYENKYFDIFEGTFTYLTNYKFDNKPREEKFLVYCMGLNDVL